MKATLLLTLPLAAAIAFVPQDPADTQAAAQGTQGQTEHVAIVSLSEMQYTNLQGTTVVVSARNVVEIRVFEDVREHIRLELLYENGDYSLIDAQALHILRNGASTREVKLVRSPSMQMRFPRLL